MCVTQIASSLVADPAKVEKAAAELKAAGLLRVKEEIEVRGKKRPVYAFRK
ncbi:hypothetical protein ACFL6M_02485 [Candidatus Eisenbacteria bacterium]|uniref:MarR family transcriptional regulator n=1 Tax=Eiseniibacteriota bacterium TaxID=2212470 RepID=A0ABV6YJF2_UNCEI